MTLSSLDLHMDVELLSKLECSRIQTCRSRKFDLFVPDRIVLILKLELDMLRIYLKVHKQVSSSSASKITT